MKHYYLILGLLLIVIMTSCTSSVEKMKRNVAEHLRKTLLVPESYKETRFEIKDTLSVKKFKIRLDTLTKDINRINNQILSWDTLINTYQGLLQKSSIYTYSDNYDGLKRCQEGKESSLILLKDFVQEKDSIEKLIKNKSDNSTIYYLVYLVYEAKNKGGNLSLSENNIYLDSVYNIRKVINLDK